jgi:flavodoxin
MRKILSLLLVSLLIFSFAACGSEKNISQGSGEESTETFAQESSGKDDFSHEEDISDAQQTLGSEGGGILIVYFSRWGNTDYPDDVDATTSASIVPDGDGRYGTTEYIANMIADEVGGDLHQIETVTPYTADFDELRDVNHDEMGRNYLPELKESNLDIAGYEVVFVGYPVWATDVPQAVLSFLNEYDLSGKTVIPFCTHDGYGAGRSYQTIADASHAAVSLDGIAIEAKDVPGAQDTVSDWLADIGIYLEQLTDGADWLTGKRLNGSDSQDTVMEWVNGLGLDFGE